MAFPTRSVTPFGAQPQSANGRMPASMLAYREEELALILGVVNEAAGILRRHALRIRFEPAGRAGAKPEAR